MRYFLVFWMFIQCLFLAGQNDLKRHYTFQKRFSHTLLNLDTLAAEHILDSLISNKTTGDSAVYYEFKSIHALGLDDIKETKRCLNLYSSYLNNSNPVFYHILKYQYLIEGDLLEEAAEELYLVKSIIDKENLSFMRAKYLMLDAVYLFKLKECNKSVINIEKAIEIYSDENDFYAVADCYKGLLNNYMYLSNKEKSKEKIYSKIELIIADGLALSRKLNYRGAYASFLYKKGSFELAKGNVEEAIMYIDSSIRLASPQYHINQLCASYFHKGTVYLKLKDLTLALKYFDTSLYYASKINAFSTISKLWMYKFNIYQTLKDNEKALLAYQKYSAFRDSVSLFNSKVKYSELEKKYDQYKNEKKIEALLKKDELNSLRVKMLIALAVIILLVLVISVRWIIKRNKKKISDAENRLNIARMNPHFFFNVMNTLQHKAMTGGINDDDGAIIATVARVMRKSLESSYLDYISIEEEVAFLSDYIKMQKMIAGHSFEVKFLTNEIDEPGALLCPVMIIQPLVENAIEHGVNNMESKGEIIVSFATENKHLKIVVKDNGQGLKEKSTTQIHHSRALQIINDRLILLNARHKQRSSLIISGNTGENGIACTLLLPLVYQENI